MDSLVDGCHVMSSCESLVVGGRWESDCSFFNGCHPWFCCGTVQDLNTTMYITRSNHPRRESLELLPKTFVDED